VGPCATTRSCEDRRAMFDGVELSAASLRGCPPRQVDDDGGLPAGSRSAGAHGERVCDHLRSRTDRETTVCARIFGCPLSPWTDPSICQRNREILHGCHAVSYFLVLKKTCTHDRQKRKNALSSHRKCFQPPFRARDRAVSRTFELRAKKNAELGPNSRSCNFPSSLVMGRMK